MVRSIEKAVFSVRWMLVTLYFGLAIGLAVYISHFWHEVLEMILNFNTYYKEQNLLLLRILELVDMVMICQLVVMTMQGGYAIFIRPLSDRLGTLPQWIKHGLGTSEQKIKLGMSILGIMGVQFLHDFIQNSHLDNGALYQRLMLAAAVLLITLSFCIFNLLMHHPMLHQKHGNDGEH